MRQSMEKSYAKVISSQLLYRIQELQILLQQSSETNTNFCNFSSIIDIIQKTIKNLQSFESHSTINPPQTYLLSKLLSLKASLNDIKITHSESTSSFLEVYKEIPNNLNNSQFLFEYFQTSVKICKEIEVFLLTRSNVFGYLDYMRIDLQNQQECEQI